MTNWMERARKCLQATTQVAAEIAETFTEGETTVSAATNLRSLRVVSKSPATSWGEKEKAIPKKPSSKCVWEPACVFGGRGSVLGGQLAEEAQKRFSFCLIHQRMLGGYCSRLASRDLVRCLLWQIVLAEPSLEKVAEVEIIPGIAMIDVLRLFAGSGEPKDLFAKERRWILAFAAIARGDRDPLCFF